MHNRPPYQDHIHQLQLNREGGVHRQSEYQQMYGQGGRPKQSEDLRDIGPSLFKKGIVTCN